MNAHKWPAFGLQVIRIGIYALRAKLDHQDRLTEWWQLVSPHRLWTQPFGSCLKEVVLQHAKQKWSELIASEPGRCCITQGCAQVRGQIYAGCRELMHTLDLTCVWSSLKSKNSKCLGNWSASRWWEQSLHQYTRNASDWSAMKKDVPTCQTYKTHLMHTHTHMVTIRKEPFAWVHAVVDAAVNLIAFDDATAVLLPKARRCVATKLSEQSVVEFCLWRWHYYRSLGSGNLVTKSSNMTHTHTHTHARNHGRKSTEHLTALWFLNASLGRFLLSFLLICEICRVFLVPIFWQKLYLSGHA